MRHSRKNYIQEEMGNNFELEKNYELGEDFDLKNSQQVGKEIELGKISEMERNGKKLDY